MKIPLPPAPPPKRIIDEDAHFIKYIMDLSSFIAKNIKKYFMGPGGSQAGEGTQTLAQKKIAGQWKNKLNFGDDVFIRNNNLMVKGKFVHQKNDICTINVDGVWIEKNENAIIKNLKNNIKNNGCLSFLNRENKQSNRKKLKHGKQ